MVYRYHASLFATVLALVTTAAPMNGADEAGSAKDLPKTETPAGEVAADKDGWKSLFNGKDLDGWKITNFGGEGEIYIEDGAVVISQGSDLSGIHTERELPKSNYEVQFEAQRAAGNDFFAGLTFPVKDSHCSLIVGGWGGGICGLSSLSGMDASENETTSYRDFESGRWYRIKLVVKDDHISAWIDDKIIVDVDTTGQRIGTRFEVDRSKPFGFATWQTTAKLRHIKIRSLPATEAGPAETSSTN